MKRGRNVYGFMDVWLRCENYCSSTEVANDINERRAKKTHAKSFQFLRHPNVII